MYIISGICTYPFLIQRTFKIFPSYEVRLLISSILICSTIIGTGYLAKRQCENNVKKLYSEGRRLELEIEKQISK